MTDSPAHRSPTGFRLALFWVIFGAFVLAVFTVVIEVTLLILLRHPPPSELFLRVLSSYYTEHDRRIVQALPECAIYDPDTTYLLRPGQCHFSNRDFHTTIHANSAGLRDSEASLAAPEVIALGDSVTMGWGVEIHETFPKLIERSCGVSVLNAGISSYATVRSLRLLKRLDQSNLRAVILQYSDNDLEENIHFSQNGNSLDIMPRKRFETMQRDHVKRNEYFPGMHAFRFIPFVVSKVYSRAAGMTSVEAKHPWVGTGSTAAEAHATHFIHALVHAEHIPPQVPIYIFEVNGRAKNNNSFQLALQELLDNTKLPSHFGPVRTVSMADELTYEKFFTLDDHINALGHRYIAQRLQESGLCAQLNLR